VRADPIVYTANTTCPKTRTLITKPKTINCIQNNTVKLAYVLLRLLATRVAGIRSSHIERAQCGRRVECSDVQTVKIEWKG
jgi:hypothetical protein